MSEEGKYLQQGINDEHDSNMSESESKGDEEEGNHGSEDIESGEDKNIVINKSYYIRTSIHCIATDNIKRLVLLSCSSEEILQAKK